MFSTPPIYQVAFSSNQIMFSSQLLVTEDIVDKEILQTR